MSKIAKIDAVEILDSRGNPNIEVMARLEGGAAISFLRRSGKLRNKL